MGNTKHYNNVLGIFLILAHNLSLAFLYTAKKELVQSIPPGLVVFFFKTTLFICILPWVFNGGIENIKTKNLPLHIVRSFFSMFAGYFYAKSLVGISTSDATAIHMIEQVILVLVGVFYFNEKMTKTRFITVVGSFMGAMLVANPNFIKSFYSNDVSYELSKYHLYVLIALLLWATNSTLVKILGNKGATPKAQTFYVMLFAAIFSAPIAYIEVSASSFDFSIITSTHIMLILALSVLYFIHTNCFFLGLKYGELPVIMPFEYFKLIFTFVLAVLFSKEANFNMGYVLIIISGVILTRYETRKKSKAKKNHSDTLESASKSIKSKVKIA